MAEEGGVSKWHPNLPSQRACTRGKEKQIAKWCKAVLCKSGEGHTITSNFGTYLMNPDQLLLKQSLAEREKDRGSNTVNWTEAKRGTGIAPLLHGTHCNT